MTPEQALEKEKLLYRFYELRAKLWVSVYIQAYDNGATTAWISHECDKAIESFDERFMKKGIE